MSSTNKARMVRSRLVEALRQELMGPSEPHETISEYPTRRYISGRLAPARAADDDADAAIDDTENDSLGVGTGDDEEGDEDASPPLIIAFNPSSFGLSFLVDPLVKNLRVLVSWGDYKRVKDDQGGTVWRRQPREAMVDGLPVDVPGAIRQIVLSSSGANLPGVIVTGVDDPEITLDGVVHDFGGYRAVSIFLVNRRTKGELGNRSKDER